MGELDSSAKGRLEQLFVACDRKGTGFLGPKELRDLCSGLGLGNAEADALFADLDRDGDGKIDYEDFAAGFREFVIQPAQKQQLAANQMSTSKDGEEQRKRREAVNRWKEMLKEINCKAHQIISSDRLQELEGLLSSTTPHPQLIISLKNVFGDLMGHLERLEKENIHLEHSFKRERETHRLHFKQLEEEMDKQVKHLKESVHQQAKEEAEAESRALRAQLDAEKAEMQAHLAIFQSFGNMVKQDQGDQTEKVRLAQGKLEEAHQDNRQLRLNLAEMQTNVALLRSDLAQMRTQYEEKCKELHKEKEVMFEYMHEHDHLTRQLHLLHEANKRLQDMNDHLRGSVDAAHLYQQMQNFRRRPVQQGSIVGDYVQNENQELTGTELNLKRKRMLARTQSVPEANETELAPMAEEISFRLGRFMDDVGEKNIDSGMSTMRDTTEFDEIVSDDEDHSRSRRSTVQVFDTSNSKIEPPLAASTPVDRPSVDICQPANDIIGPPERTFKVVFAGDAAVGKSTFILRVSKGIFIPTISSTLGVDFHMRTIKVDNLSVTLQLWDTAGQERFRSLTKTYFRKADGVMLLFDCTNEKSFLNVRNWMEAIDEVIDKRLPIILCANKTDLRESMMAQGRRVIHPEDGERLARDFGAIYIETSAKNGDNVSDTVVQLTRQMVANEDREVKLRANIIDIGKEVPQKRGCGCSK